MTSLLDPSPRRQTFDIAVIGAGLVGSLAAAGLARLGFSVVLVDRHAEARPEFRAEQLVGAQIGLLARLGVLAGMVGDAAPQRTTITGRAGRVIDRTTVDQFGLTYEAMVGAIRAAVPPEVRRVFGRVVALRRSGIGQTAVLADGAVIETRLLVLATGLAPALARATGVSYRTIRADHSLTLGFDLVTVDRRAAAAQPLVYLPPNTRDRIDYLATFPMDGRLRANLFCYHAPNSAWTDAFRRYPARCLSATLPGLDRLLGPLAVSSPVEIRSNDLRVAADPVRQGLVLIGDAFQTPCPAAGTGIDRLLSDVSVLLRHAPTWLASPGMDCDKIETFYADPAKRAVDAEALRIAEYRRAVSTETGWKWRVHRARVDLRRRARLAASGLPIRWPARSAA